MTDAFPQTGASQTSSSQTGSPEAGCSEAGAAAAVSRLIAGAAPGDVDRAVARLDPEDMAALGLRSGDLVRLTAERSILARALMAPAAQRGRGEIRLDEVQRGNLGAVLGAPARAEPGAAEPAVAATLEIAEAVSPALAERLGAALLDTPLLAGQRLRIRLTDGGALDAEIAATEPEGAVIVTGATRISIAPPRAAQPAAYGRIAGLDRQIEAVREMVELPLQRPDLFTALGVEPPRGVLFTGPPGSGKTLLARTVAERSAAHFLEISGPEIVSKHYGDSEKRLRQLFETAAARAPSVIFIDEIDAIAQRRDGMAEDRQLEKRVVAQLLTLMDGVRARSGVVVMAATNLPNSLDPALRRPGRFDREIAFTPPGAAGRAAILKVHTASMRLAPEVDLGALGEATHGFVGADLAALAREAGLAALRRLRGPYGGYPASLEGASVGMADFETALGAVGPSAVRDVAIAAPAVRWSDVAGYDEVKAALAEAVIWPRRYASAFRKLQLEPVRGVLLSGPPGAGKTHLARALATEAGVNFIAIRGAQLLSRHLGESERAVRELFAKARQTAPCILFFDEIDALAPARAEGADGPGAAASRVVAQLLTELDGVEERRGVFVLGATNRLGALDPALIRPGRFDLALEIAPPDAATRAEILAAHMRGAPLAEAVDLSAWGARLEGATGADLKAFAAAARRGALRRAIRAGAVGAFDPTLEAVDLEEAAALMRGSAETKRRAAEG
ncbi:MAG: AAA family ATPase [Pseudomonadota bacterium]